jgi:L-amino acid N-acyltransferase YncA
MHMSRRYNAHLGVRRATETDAAAMQAIYAPIVCSTFTSFETREPSVEEMRERLLGALPSHPWLVADDDDVVTGFAYASRHRERAAYQWSVDVSVYVHAAHRGRGVGRRLYTALLERLRTHGFVNAYAGIALPNDASVRLHESFGFTPVGIYRNVGFKLGAWRDVGWWQLLLREPPAAPEPPTA